MTVRFHLLAIYYNDLSASDDPDRAGLFNKYFHSVYTSSSLLYLYWMICLFLLYHCLILTFQLMMCFKLYVLYKAPGTDSISSAIIIEVVLVP